MNTEKSMLLKPLFIGGMFNREGKRQRFVFVRQITDGEKNYNLYISANKSEEREYPEAENDKYILFADVNGWITTLRTTEHYLAKEASFKGISKEQVIFNYLDYELKAYEAYKNGLGGYPSFIGAAMINDLSNCIELSKKYKAEREARWKRESADGMVLFDSYNLFKEV